MRKTPEERRRLAEPRLNVVKLSPTSPEWPEPGADPTEPATNLVEAVTEELRRADRLGTPLGLAALLVASRLQSSEDASKLAALTKEFRATLAAALDGARGEGSELDAIRQRYGRRTGA